MKKDNDLLRSILFAIQETENTSEIKFICESSLQRLVNDKEFAIHLNMLHEVGFVKGRFIDLPISLPKDGKVYLTYDGYEAFALIEDDSIYKKAIEIVSASGTANFRLILDVAENLISDKIEFFASMN